jgi:hypothetical protein
MEEYSDIESEVSVEIDSGSESGEPKGEGDLEEEDPVTQIFKRLKNVNIQSHRQEVDLHYLKGRVQSENAADHFAGVQGIRTVLMEGIRISFFVSDVL